MSQKPGFYCSLVHTNYLIQKSFVFFSRYIMHALKEVLLLKEIEYKN